MIAVNDSNFDEVVLKSKVPVICDFWATWCSPCRRLKSSLEELAKSSNGEYIVVGIDIDESQNLAKKYQVNSIPAIFIFKDGEVKDNFIGIQTKETLLHAVKL